MAKQILDEFGDVKSDIVVVGENLNKLKEALLNDRRKIDKCLDILYKARANYDYEKYELVQENMAELAAVYTTIVNVKR